MLEWSAALCSVLGVWLMARRRLSAWPVGLLSVTLYGLVFAEAKLYSDTLLQVAFGGFLVYGWLNWRQHAADEGSIRIVPLARGKLLRDLAFGLCGGVALGAAMHTFTDAALPWLDAMLTALSLVAILFIKEVALKTQSFDDQRAAAAREEIVEASAPAAAGIQSVDLDEEFADLVERTDVAEPTVAVHGDTGVGHGRHERSE